MCGIAGIITQNLDLNLPQLSAQMARSLAHRGPDDNDYWIEKNLTHCQLGMVHTRLSIQDLSAHGRQPMQSASQRYCIVYNGEVYNFKRLRSQLESKGYSFSSGSDTEVILAAIEAYGLHQAVALFEGMFAFALWDKKHQTLSLCRDRLGEKPLYYGWYQDSFYWTSELKALQQLDSWKAPVNHAILPQYLKYGYVPQPDSIYEKHYKLLPGSILSFSLEQLFSAKFSPKTVQDKATICPKPYWNLADFTSKENRNTHLSYAQAVESLDELLNHVVQDQMISDVPFGAFLSGGIDSSLTTSIMQAQSQVPINTFTIGFKEKDYNEAGFAAEIAKHLGTNHHEMIIESKDCLNLVQNIPQIMSEPFADSSVLPAYFVSKMAREEVTVALSGDAGDELFCGYNRYTHTAEIWTKLNRLPYPIRQVLSKTILLFPPAMYETIYNLLSKALSSSNKNTRVGLKIQKLAKMLAKRDSTEIYEMLIAYCQPEDSIPQTTATYYNLLDSDLIANLDSQNDFIEKAMAVDTLTYLPDDNLTKVDRTSMASSLETRLPLLNHKVVEFAWTLPLEFKYQNGVSKRILRDVLFKRVPKALIERPKMGFSVPIADWLKGPLKHWSESLLIDPQSHSHGLLNQSHVAQMWQQHLSGKRDNSAALWSILMFQAWYANQAN
ncbi:asparagine synthase (glutamine-hydrolyzing) [Aliikangiella sp. IMCC44653]